MHKMISLLFTFVGGLSACACLASTTNQPSRRQSSTGDGGRAGGDLDHFVYPKWSILNFNGACSPGGCLLTFNLSSAATTSEPAIRAACDNINGDELYWQPCTTLAGVVSSSSSTWSKDDTGRDDSSIWALPLPSVDSLAVSVQHRFSNVSLTPTRYYNVTGNVTVDLEQVKLPVNLTVVGMRVSESWSWTDEKDG